MGKACSGGATGECRAVTIQCFSFTGAALPSRHNFAAVSASLGISNKIDLAPSLNFV